MRRMECYIKRCADLTDPLEDPEGMSLLPEIRREKIKKYKTPADRKRGFCAGLMIAEHLKAHGKSADEIRYNEHGRPYLNGLDFNISHTGDYVVMALSDFPVGCDIEQIRRGKDSIIKRFFSTSEKEWMEDAKNRQAAFCQIWTARESYVKYTGEGISLDFQRYEVKIASSEGEAPPIQGDLADVPYLGTAKITRDEKLQDCEIHQWLYEQDCVISLCGDFSTAS